MLTRGPRRPDVSDSCLLRMAELLLCLPECRQEGKRKEDLLCRVPCLLCPPDGQPCHLEDLLRWPGGLLYWPEGLLYQSAGFLYQQEVLLTSVLLCRPGASFIVRGVTYVGQMVSSKAATFRPANPQHAGSNYPHGLLRVAQAIFQRTRVLRGYQIFGTHHFIQKLYEIRVS